MRRRTTSAVGGALLAIALLTACVPEPAPSPTPTGFASEDEAFAAAEATYRAYIDAINQVDLSAPETFEPVYKVLIDDALNSAKQSFSEMHAEEWTVGGESRITQIDPKVVSRDPAEVALAVCVDVSTVTLVDSNGVSQIGERPTEQSLAVTVLLAENEWRISEFNGREGSPQCAP